MSARTQEDWSDLKAIVSYDAFDSEDECLGCMGAGRVQFGHGPSIECRFCEGSGLTDRARVRLLAAVEGVG